MRVWMPGQSSDRKRLPFWTTTRRRCCTSAFMPRNINSIQSASLRLRGGKSPWLGVESFGVKPSMIRIIPVASLDDQMSSEPGLTVMLDIKQKDGEFFIKPGSAVKIHRPNGTSVDLVAKGVSISGDYVALFFPGLDQHKVPK